MIEPCERWGTVAAALESKVGTTCPCCMCVAYRYDTADSKLSRIHASEEVETVCPYCDTDYWHPAQLRRHVMRIHPGTPKAKKYRQ